MPNTAWNAEIKNTEQHGETGVRLYKKWLHFSISNGERMVNALAVEHCDKPESMVDFERTTVHMAK